MSITNYHVSKAQPMVDRQMLVRLLRGGQIIHDLLAAMYGMFL
jgi:hypothetical protein